MGASNEVAVMKVIETKLPGCVVIEPAVFGDERGFFYEGWNAGRFAEHGLLTQFVHDLAGCIYTDVSHDQCFFQFFIEIIINFRIAVKHIIETLYHIISGFGKTALQAGKKSTHVSLSAPYQSG